MKHVLSHQTVLAPLPTHVPILQVTHVWRRWLETHNANDLQILIRHYWYMVDDRVNAFVEEYPEGDAAELTSILSLGMFEVLRQRTGSHVSPILTQHLSRCVDTFVTKHKHRTGVIDDVVMRDIPDASKSPLEQIVWHDFIKAIETILSEPCEGGTYRSGVKNQLLDRNQDIFMSRMFNGDTLESLATKYGIDKERVRQIMKTVLLKLQRDKRFRHSFPLDR
jgi:Mor family transcriptional regulator